MSYDRRRLRGDHPAACTCFDCEERRKWRLPRTSRSRQAPTAPPAKPPATREDVTRQTPTSPPPPSPSSLPTTGPGQRSGTTRPGGYIPTPPTTPPSRPAPRQQARPSAQIRPPQRSRPASRTGQHSNGTGAAGFLGKLLIGAAVSCLIYAAYTFLASYPRS